MLARVISGCDPNVWSGRALQEGLWTLADAVLRQCIRSPIGVCAPGHHGYQRACDLVTGKASTGPFGSPVFARAGKTGPPSSSHPLAELGGLRVLIMSSIASHGCAVPLFVPGGRSFVPTCGFGGAPSARTVKVGRCACLASRASVARPCLDGPEHGARIKRVGTRHWS